jgi:hypothetical protein
VDSQAVREEARGVWIPGGGTMFEELYHLLNQLGLGAAARPVCDLVADLMGESMSLQLLQQEILTVLHRHGGAHSADAVLSALVELGFAGLSRAHTDQSTNEGVASAEAAMSSSALLATTTNSIVAQPRASRAIHETARAWLDIDSGIYFDVRQHVAGSE